jgi:hypothetical protein
MCLIRDGALNGSDGAIHERWNKTAEDQGMFCPKIAGSMSHTRFLQLKRCYKLCDNDKAPKRGQEGYDPAYTFDFIYKTMVVYNTNVLTKYANSDQCVDETIFGHGGCGEPGSGLISRFQQKKVSKGGQTVLSNDVHRNCLQMYTHRHKVHEKPKGWGWEGQCEMRRLVEEAQTMLLTPAFSGREALSISALANKNKFHKEKFVYQPQPLFRVKPHFTADNYFGGELIDRFIGERGFGFMHTVLPPDVPDHFHKKTQDTYGKRTICAQFFPPVTAVKTVSVPAGPDGGRATSYTIEPVYHSRAQGLQISELSIH